MGRRQDDTNIQLTNLGPRWVLIGQKTEVLPVHAALLHTGKAGRVLFFSGDQSSKRANAVWYRSQSPTALAFADYDPANNIPNLQYSGLISNTRVFDCATGAVEWA